MNIEEKIRDLNAEYVRQSSIDNLPAMERIEGQIRALREQRQG